MKLWIARDENECLCLFRIKPEYDTESGEWVCDGWLEDYQYLPKEMFPEVTFENSPVLFANEADDLLDDTIAVKSSTPVQSSPKTKQSSSKRRR